MAALTNFRVQIYAVPNSGADILMKKETLGKKY